MYRARDQRRAWAHKHYQRDLEITKIPQYNISIWWDEGKGRVVHPGRGARSGQLKKICNRRLRRKLKHGHDVANGGNYKRYTDFWWVLY